MSCVADEVVEHNIWSVETGKGISQHALSPDGTRLAVAQDCGDVQVLDTVNAETLSQLQAHEGGVISVKWSPAGDLLATAGEDGRICLWQYEEQGKGGRKLTEYTAGDGWVEDIAWSPDGKYLAAVCGKTLSVWNQVNKRVFSCDRHASTVTALGWHPDSRRLLTSSYRGISVFDVLYPNKPPMKLVCPDSLITASWSSDGKYISAGSQDKRVHVWKIKGDKSKHFEMSGYPAKVCACDWAGHATKLATAGGNNIVVWDVSGKGPAGSKPSVLERHTARIVRLAYHPQGELLASAATDGEVCVWGGLSSKELVLRFSMTDEVTGLQWSATGSVLYVADCNGHLSAFDVA